MVVQLPRSPMGATGSSTVTVIVILVGGGSNGVAGFDSLFPAGGGVGVRGTGSALAFAFDFPPPPFFLSSISSASNSGNHFLWYSGVSLSS
eukprot:CAMPEP_0172772752 /NCGR_PEP_ID=MMETSP1074-20121228/192960_1 /TAXON_ID=2916 /ORGANISM="Ceratium fusus, Strain PA161109" /LENGTH=90 /DNA_ID=CAMNT_0013608921 /DNA_START=321 /DNA_END=589 /DNA_ORIENTATION=-